MTEPDFDQIAENLSHEIDDPWHGPKTISSDLLDHLRRETATALRQVWNARGAADIAVLSHAACEGGDYPSVLHETADRAIRSLDR